MSMCRVFSYVVGRECLLWLVCSRGKTLLAFAQLHFGLHGQICFTPGISWLPTFAFQSPVMKGHLFRVLVLEGLLGHHRIVQLQHYWLGHRLGLLWYWMVCLEMTAVHRVTKSQTRLTDFTFTFHFHALKKEMATHSSVLARRILGTGEPGGLPSVGLHRVGHDWSDLAAAAAAMPSSRGIHRSMLMTHANDQYSCLENSTD